MISNKCDDSACRVLKYLGVSSREVPTSQLTVEGFATSLPDVEKRRGKVSSSGRANMKLKRHRSRIYKTSQVPSTDNLGTGKSIMKRNFH